MSSWAWVAELVLLRLPVVAVPLDVCPLGHAVLVLLAEVDQLANIFIHHRVDEGSNVLVGRLQDRVQ